MMKIWWLQHTLTHTRQRERAMVLDHSHRMDLWGEARERERVGEAGLEGARSVRWGPTLR